MTKYVRKISKNQFQVRQRIGRDEITRLVTEYLLYEDHGLAEYLEPEKSLAGFGDEEGEFLRLQKIVKPLMTDKFCLQFVNAKDGKYLFVYEIGADDGSYDEELCDLIADLIRNQTQYGKNN